MFLLESKAYRELVNFIFGHYNKKIYDNRSELQNIQNTTQSDSFVFLNTCNKFYNMIN